MEHSDNMKVWFQKLRTTPLRQATGRLIDVDLNGQVRGACCLGVGMIAMGAERVMGSALPEVGDVQASRFDVFLVGGNRYDVLPPGEFVSWLGVEHYTNQADRVLLDTVAADLVVDWPEDLTVPRSTVRYTEDSDVCTCAGLNDTEMFTFDQIADIVEYFGVYAGHKDNQINQIN